MFLKISRAVIARFFLVAGLPARTHSSDENKLSPIDGMKLADIN